MVNRPSVVLHVSFSGFLKEKTYKIIPTDPTKRQKSKLIQILKKIKEEGGMSESTYKIYPTGAVIQIFYGLQKIHKAGLPLRPIVSSRDVSFLQHSKATGQDLKTIGRQNNLQCLEHQGLCRSSKEHQATTR